MQSCCRLLRNDLMKNRCFRAFIIPVLLLCLSVQSMPAQNDMPDGRFIAISFIEINSGYARCIDSTCVDSSYINIIYRHIYKKDEDTSVFPRQNYETLFVGKRYSLFLGYKGQCIDKMRIITDKEEMERVMEKSRLNREKMMLSGMLADKSLFYLWILKDKFSLMEKVAIADRWYNYLNETGAFDVPGSLVNFYDEPFPEFSWEITGDTAEVFGYDCIRAECDFRGRHWTAWFAPEIAVNEGPWKLRGLPGLILKAEADGGWFTYECVGIDTEPRPIYRYHYDNERTMKYKRYMKYERHCFEDAVYILWDLLLPIMRDDLVKGGGGSFPYYPMEYLPGKNKSGKREK